MNAREMLDELLEAERAAKERQAELADAANRRRGELNRALAARDELDRADGAGLEVDPDEEQRLAELLADRGVERRDTDRGTILVDRRAEARRDGAAEAVVLAGEAVQRHARAHVAELLAQVARRSGPARDELAAAVETIDAAEAGWRRVSSDAHRLVNLAAGSDDDRETLMAMLLEVGWRLPTIPLALDSQALVDYRSAAQRDPNALLPVAMPENSMPDGTVVTE